MITRIAEKKARELLTYFPAIAIIGPRQVGKTTLAKTIVFGNEDSLYLDLESPRDLNKIIDTETFLSQYADKTIVIDEVQRKRELFPVLRSIIDKKNRPGRFILLGSASPELIRDSSESLAGRIAYLELSPFLIPEITESYTTETLWFRGGFPEPFLGKKPWIHWMGNFIKTYIERDLPMLGFNSKPALSERFWTMLSHLHGNALNMNDLSKSLEISVNTIKSYLSFFESAFLIRLLQPYHSNIKKRLVKSPKVYIRDCGILHYFLGLNNPRDIYGHPGLGASWEGFIIEQIVNLMPDNRKAYYYRTYDGAEIDLIIEKGGKPFVAIEIKFGSDTRPSKGNTQAIQTLKTKHNFLVVKENEDYMLSEYFRVVGIELFLQKYLPEL
ncbi:MAG: ATP-binding protein [Bacteroidales bacterium]|nr:ATP-binding protein [Bacteroidales bacterium]